MLYSFPELVAYCAKTRKLPAGTIITSGAISTYGHGDACIAEKQRRVKMDHDMSDVDFLKVGDVVSIDFFVLDEFGKYHPKSLFGTLENKVVVR
ncbi:fumarylacetoacetate hydrolase family protein [Pseudomonas sp. IT-P176]|uniref:fumarylacetoacetate hydrolase family protein n=1 Tax=Pseudomonas sp. IT-P176 TaxID=3026444 RepID=UPI0039E037C2